MTYRTKLPESLWMIGSQRYNTMRSLYRGHDQDRKRRLGLDQPASYDIKPERKQRVFPSLPDTHLDVDMVFLPQQPCPHFALFLPNTLPQNARKMYNFKGLDYEHAYRLNRNQDIQYKLHKTNKSDKAGPPRAHRIEKRPNNQQNHKQSEHGYDWNYKNKSKIWELRVKARILRENYTPCPTKHVSNNDPQTFVSSQRMRQLLSRQLAPIKSKYFYHDHRI